MLATHAPETDLYIPLPEEGETLDPHTINTHYFSFAVPEAKLGAFLYIRYMPAFPLAQGGVALFRGLDNHCFNDVAFLDVQNTMPYPELRDGSVETANGLKFTFTNPGREARIEFVSRQGDVRIDLTQTALTPLFARGHVIPGEDDHHKADGKAGGTEQFMHCLGTVEIRGEVFDVDCYAPRDRSWNQVRTEDQGGARRMPPLCWTPICFGEDLVFNQVSVEHPDTDPAYLGIYEFPDDQPTHHFAWLYVDREARAITRVRRNVLEYHPTLFYALRQEIEAEDEKGRAYRFTGHAIAAAPVPTWPNCTFYDTVYRWEDQDGRVAFASCQEVWADEYQRGMRQRASGRVAALVEQGN